MKYNMKNMKLSTQPYKGARDFYPEDKRLQKQIFNTMKTVVEKFGYEEYDAPILESIELYKAKSGEEIVNEQTYTFTDRGGREVVIRPEMTPTVSRMVAARRQELGYPLRWYSIPNLWRYERPQKGRLREHWQLNVDIFGVEELTAEHELIELCDSMMKQFGASSSMYQIHLNNRGLMDYIMSKYLELNSKQSYKLSKIIDRMNKISASQLKDEVTDLLELKQKQQGVDKKIFDLLGVKELDDLPEEIKNSKPAQEIKTLIEMLDNSNITNVVFDIGLMRGFDYYTGIVFEMFDTDPENNRSMMGGGRYNGLVGLFGVEPVPTVGFGWGDVTLANFLESHGLMSQPKSETDIYLILVGDVYNQSQKLIKSLREEGLRVSVDATDRKISTKIKSALKKDIRYAMFIGKDELNENIYKFKDLITENEQSLSPERIISTILDERKDKLA